MLVQLSQLGKIKLNVVLFSHYECELSEVLNVTYWQIRSVKAVGLIMGKKM